MAFWATPAWQICIFRWNCFDKRCWCYDRKIKGKLNFLWLFYSWIIATYTRKDNINPEKNQISFFIGLHFYYLFRCDLKLIWKQMWFLPLENVQWNLLMWLLGSQLSHKNNSKCSQLYIPLHIFLWQSTSIESCHKFLFYLLNIKLINIMKMILQMYRTPIVFYALSPHSFDRV